ncbi:carboxypeptidase B-like [Copidosoma floridanum]|uniref:carboxypeptidase B-like n=1 Tax=Copidosoma floridanum TaxID=29053 RepID=UPI0006C9CD1A|nr:carboxypeptidase B-like [Copidosoma floridanum]
MRRLIVILVVSLAAASTRAKDDHDTSSIDGMQGIRIWCGDRWEHDHVYTFVDQRGFDFLRLPWDTESPIDVFVAADRLNEFKSGLDENRIRYQVIVQNMSEHLENEVAVQRMARRNRFGGEIFATFPRYDEMQDYLRKLAETRGDIVKYFTIGRSYEGRDIGAVKISSGGENKPAVFIDAGIHAREWVAPTTALYAVKQLVENATNHHLFEKVDVYVVPSLNPDGYEYTHQTKKSRMWRKTRSVNPNSSCLGVDANRNFEYKWMTIGASSDPCSDIYAGSEPFSEPETAALRDFFLANKGIKIYLSFHSYGQYLLHPWGWTSSLPSNEPILRAVAEKAEAALSKVRGTRYMIGSSTNVLYSAAGGSDDWAQARGGVELAYTIELPSAAFGFAPPPKEIVPIGMETFEAIKVFIQYAEAGESFESTLS